MKPDDKPKKTSENKDAKTPAVKKFVKPAMDVYVATEEDFPELPDLTSKNNKATWSSEHVETKSGPVCSCNKVCSCNLVSTCSCVGHSSVSGGSYCACVPVTY